MRHVNRASAPPSRASPSSTTSSSCRGGVLATATVRRPPRAGRRSVRVFSGASESLGGDDAPGTSPSTSTRTVPAAIFFTFEDFAHYLRDELGLDPYDTSDVRTRMAWCEYEEIMSKQAHMARKLTLRAPRAPTTTHPHDLGLGDGSGVNPYGVE